MSDTLFKADFGFVTNDEGYTKEDVDAIFPGTDRDPESVPQEDVADALKHHLWKQAELFIRAYPSLFRQYLV